MSLSSSSLRPALRTAGLLLAFAFLSCSAIETSRANDELTASLAPLMGKTKDEVYARLGTPDSRRELGPDEIWGYYRSYGLRAASVRRELPGNLGSGRPSQASFEPDAGTGARSAHEAYDRFSIYFLEGVAVHWDGHASR